MFLLPTLTLRHCFTLSTGCNSFKTEMLGKKSSPQSLAFLKLLPFCLFLWVSGLSLATFWVLWLLWCWDISQLNFPEVPLYFGYVLKLFGAPTRPSELECPLNFFAKRSLLSNSLLSYLPILVACLRNGFLLWDLLDQPSDCTQCNVLHNIFTRCLRVHSFCRSGWWWANLRIFRHLKHWVLSCCIYWGSTTVLLWARATMKQWFQNMNEWNWWMK